MKVSQEPTSVTKTFTYVFQMCSTTQDHELELPLNIPFEGCIKEYVQRVLDMFKLPCFVEKGLLAALDSFIREETLKFYDEVSEKAVKEIKDEHVNIDQLIKMWEQAFKEETVMYATPKGASDEEVFAEVYRGLVHSPALATLVQVEHSYSRAIEDLALQRDDQKFTMVERQRKELGRVVQGALEHEVSDVATRQLEEQVLLEGRWNSELDSLKQTQRREYRDWLVRAFEDFKTAQTLPSPTLPVLAPTVDRQYNSEDTHPPPPILEESFTIHLGSQMKQMHNVRILAADIMGLCRTHSSSSDPAPQRLHTALGLYSSDLNGLVLLTDDKNDSLAALKKEFITVSEKSTEFHFESIGDQLEKIREESGMAIAWRESLSKKTKDDQNHSASPCGATARLQTGDVYITRHSNLAEVHVVFHISVDDTLRSSDINSRHPVILGLRNVLKTACLCDITTFTIPVLLVHEMTEEMTVVWCTKRAELVFKCVKGFMIEMASWGGSELKNVQFLIPKGISEEVFTTLASMIPGIFRVANPLVLKPSGNTQKAS